MQISLKGVFLSQKTITKDKDGKQISKLVGYFHQPTSKNNALIPVIMPDNTKLEQ
jgi:hypothetical protein